MSSRNRKDSEYSDIYKLKSGTSNARSKRLQRRSLDWKNQRDDELNKRRDLANLSPVQELSQIHADTSYKGKTPVKTDSKAKTLKQKLAKWKQEKEAKKKQAEKEKKPTFRVFHVEHKDKDLFSKDKKNLSSSSLKKSASLHVTEPGKTHQKHTESVAAKPTKTTVNTKKTIAPEKTHTRVSTTKKTTSSKSQNPQKVSNSGEIFKKPVSSRTTRSVTANVQTSISTRTTRQTAASNKNKGQDTRKNQQAANKKAKQIEKEEVNLNNVSTYRGDSFAPNDFTFTVPANISSFTFTPLSPASSAAFLYPNQDGQNSVSFLGSVPKRSSTPKKGSNAAFKDEAKMDDSDKTLMNDKTVDNTCISDSQSCDVTKKELSGAENLDSSTTQCDSGISNMDQSKDTQMQTRSDNSMVEVDSEIPKRLTRSMRRSESVRDRSSSKRRSDQTMSASDTEEKIPKRRRKSTRKSVSTHVQIKVQVELHSAAVTDEEDRGSEIQSDSDTNNINSKCVIESDTDTETKNTRSKAKISVTPVEKSSSKKDESKEDDINSEATSKNVPECSPLRKKNTGRRKSNKLQNESSSSLTPKTVKTPKSGAEGIDAVSDEVFSEEKENTTVKTNVTISDNNNMDVLKDVVENCLPNSTPKVKPRRSVRKSLSTNANTPQSSQRKSRKSVLKEQEDNAEETEKKEPVSEIESKIKSQDEKQIQEKDEEKPREKISEKNEDNLTPSRRTTRSTRKSMSAVEGFLIPSTDALVLSSKKSTAKKRRKTTTHDKDLLNKSPEEWVKLLAKSPMIEMSRRTPKPKSPVEKDPTLTLNFDELDESLLCGEVPACVFEDEPAITDKTNDVEMEDVQTTQSKEMTEEKQNDNQDNKMEVNSQKEHHVPYFRKLLITETDKLNEFCDKWQNINDTSDLKEEARGQIRTCIGQAQLLISQRFKQFSGLVDNCEFKLGEKETTCTDLQGFWDMIYFQVEDVHIKFSDLQKLKDNNWISDKPEPVKKVVKKIVTKPKTSKPQGKSKFAEFRNQMKKQKEGVVPINVFDGGFFKVASPAKSPKVHCEGGTPKAKSVEKREEMKRSPEQKQQIETSSSLNSTEEKKQPLQELTVPNTYTSPIITPARKRSYIPVVPSPLLTDSTPQPRPKRRSSVKKLLTDQENTEIGVSNTENNDTGKNSSTDDNLTEIKDSRLASALHNDHNTSVTEKVTKSALRRSTRQSIRTRKSVSFCNLETNDLVSSDSTAHQEVPQQDQQDDLFSMYLQPTSARLSLAPEKSILEQHFGNDSFSDDIESAIGDENYLETSKIGSQKRKRRSSLKDLPSKDKRRSTRRSSVSFPSPINENPLVSVSDNSDANSDSSVFSPQKRRFSNLNVGFTPVSKKARPSLLYTPPSEQNKSGRSVQDVPTATLISFSP